MIVCQLFSYMYVNRPIINIIINLTLGHYLPVNTKLFRFTTPQSTWDDICNTGQFQFYHKMVGFRLGMVHLQHLHTINRRLGSSSMCSSYCCIPYTVNQPLFMPFGKLTKLAILTSMIYGIKVGHHIANNYVIFQTTFEIELWFRKANLCEK